LYVFAQAVGALRARTTPGRVRRARLGVDHARFPVVDIVVDAVRRSRSASDARARAPVWYVPWNRSTLDAGRDRDRDVHLPRADRTLIVVVGCRINC